MKKNNTETSLCPLSGYVFIWDNYSFKKVSVEEICFLAASRSYCEIHVTNGKRYVVSRPMSEVAAFLPADRFIRVHRSYVLNMHAVETLTGNTFTLTSGEQIPVGREYRQTVYPSLLFIGTKNHKYGK